MAAGVVGMAFIPYYSHIMNILETDKDLKKTFHGKYICPLSKLLLWLVSV